MPKYVAEVAPVREVALIGTADLDYWSDQLKAYDLIPTTRDGRALLQIGAMESRYRGLRFREFSFAVMTCQFPGGTARDGVFLPHAFNSRLSFAFAERTFFRTPYYAATIELDVCVPASMTAVLAGKTLCRASMRSGSDAATRKATRDEMECWEGPVYLPHPPRSGGKGKLHMFARLAGVTQTYLFKREEDELTLRASTNTPIIKELVDSNFECQEWAIRTDATHARSKTFTREIGTTRESG